MEHRRDCVIVSISGGDEELSERREPKTLRYERTKRRMKEKGQRFTDRTSEDSTSLGQDTKICGRSSTTRGVCKE